MRKHMIAALVGVLALGAIGCKSKTKKSEATAEATASAEPEPLGLKGDPELVTALQAMVANCQIDEKTARVRGCQGQEKRNLTSLFARKKKSRSDSLETFVNALESDDAKLRTVAASILHSAFRSNLGTGEPKVDPQLATRLRTVVEKTDPKLAMQIVPAAVHASLLAKQDKELFAMLDQPDRKALRVAGYRHLMAHGGMRVFPKIKEVAAGPEIGAAAAAISGVRTVTRKGPEERKVLCDWGLEVLKDPRGAVASKAGSLLIDCKEDYIDALIAEGSARLKAGTFDGAFGRAFRTVCTTAGSRPAAGSDAQCKRTRSLLNQVMKHPKVSSATKGTVLMALAMQWPDDETKALATKLEKADDNVLATRAKQAVRHMERRERREQARAAQQAGARPAGHPDISTGAKAIKKPAAATPGAPQVASPKAAAPKPAAPKPAPTPKAATPAAP